MTLLEIMIVLAILALVMGLIVGPAVMNKLARSRGETTKLMVRKYAHEAYPSWAAVSAKACPDKLSDLHEYTNDKKTTDAWGHELVMTCGASNPPGVRGLGIRSIGEDGVPNSADDIVSWE